MQLIEQSIVGLGTPARATDNARSPRWILRDQWPHGPVQPLLPVPWISNGVLLVEGEGRRRRAEPFERFEYATTSRSGLDLEEAECAEHLGLQGAVSRQKTVQRAPMQSAQRKFRPRDRGHGDCCDELVMKHGMHRSGIASPHLVPVVRAEDDLGRALDTHLAQRDEIIESPVRSALDSKESKKLIPVRRGREPLIDPVVGVADDPPQGRDASTGTGPADATQPSSVATNDTSSLALSAAMAGWF